MKRHILLIDDSPTIRVSASLCLRNEGFLVTEAVDGRDALQRLHDIREQGVGLSLILTDINMPEMDGITLIRKVKEGPFRFVPILVLTTESEEAVMLEGKAAGASGWLLKPFHPEQLISAVKKLVWTP